MSQRSDIEILENLVEIIDEHGDEFPQGSLGALIRSIERIRTLERIMRIARSNTGIRVEE